MSAILAASHVKVAVSGKRHWVLGDEFMQRQRVEILQDVSLEVAEGETLALIGESGSGKSTLAMALSGLRSVQAGSVHFRGDDLATYGARQRKAFRRQVSLMLQDPIGSLSPRFTIRQLLLEPFKVHGVHVADRKKLVEKLLGMVELPVHLADRRPGELSGGQARRVGVARALALKPDVLIADEPTAGLDMSVQAGILNLLTSLQHEMRMTMIMITHDLGVVRHMAHRVAVMYLGQIVECGAMDGVMHAPRHPYTAALLSASVSKRQDMAEDVPVEGEVPSLLHRPHGCSFSTRCPFAQPICFETAPDVSLDVEEPGHSYRCHFPLRAGLNEMLPESSRTVAGEH